MRLRPVYCLALILCSSAIAEEPAAFFSRPLLLGAHRGGALLWPENTVLAFQETAKRWPEVLLESDVWRTKDNQLVLMHDGAVDRTTEGSGKIADMTLEEIRKLDAGYRFTQDEGKTYPYRGQGLRVPTLHEALTAAPQHRFLLELKAPQGAVDAFLQGLEAEKAFGRVLIASFNADVMEEMRLKKPEAIYCYDRNNGMALLGALRSDKWEAYQPAAPVLSVMIEMQRQFQITAEEIARIQAKGIIYQLHTLNTREEITRALEEGVKSILTDDPALLDQVLQERSAAQAAPKL